MQMNGKHCKGKHDSILCGVEKGVLKCSEPSNFIAKITKMKRKNEPSLNALSKLIKA